MYDLEYGGLKKRKKFTGSLKKKKEKKYQTKIFLIFFLQFRSRFVTDSLLQTSREVSKMKNYGAVKTNSRESKNPKTDLMGAGDGTELGLSYQKALLISGVSTRFCNEVEFRSCLSWTRT
mmetsp:Transcript_4262/g.6715  ORF Transcript_4262/g.6715 Transcript_4262/m.6715 type:complete len:120 (+) Transcript_4262:1555-1914(+)